MSFGLSHSDLNAICEVFNRYPQVSKVLIYGSRALGTQRQSSDIDLTLKGDISHEEFNNISIELDDLMLPYQFDLSVFDHIDNPDLLAHIQQHSKELC